MKILKKLKYILLLGGFSKTLQQNDLVSKQRLQVFKITTLFALLVFAGGIYQVSLNIMATMFLLVMSILFIALFINYFALAFHKKPVIAFIILLLLSFAVLHICSYGQGGIRNSGILYLGSLILIAYMLLGKAAGKIMAAIFIVHVIYFYFISVYTDWTDYSFIGTDPRLIDLDFLISGTLSIMLLTAQSNFIETSKSAIINDIKSKKNELSIKNDQLLNSQRALNLANIEYEEQNKELTRKNKELEQFAYVASHDLQEPLRTTSSFVDLLQQQYKGRLDEKADKYLDYILEASGRMKTLITDLLEYSGIGHQQELKQVNCDAVLKEVLSDLNTAIIETGAEIKSDVLPVINGYPTEIKQLFQNLAYNAIKFRKKDQLPRLKISACKINNDWQFAFTDNGIGIAKEHSERIFVIFQRLHTRNEYKGSGIGLSHCKKIVELHNGKIWLVSVPGEGTTFYFTIPQKNNTTKTS